MTETIKLTSICIPSEDLVTREIEGEVLLVPLVSGMVDGDDAIYSLSATGSRIWALLDGKRTLYEISSELEQSFNAPITLIQEDVLGFINELTSRSMVHVLN